MRKHTILTTIVSGIFLLFLAKGGYATALIGPGITSNPDRSYTVGAYTIYDNSSSSHDKWKADIGGYYFLDDPNDSISYADYTGYYIGTVAGNDDGTALSYLASYFLGQDVTVTQEGKYDYDDPTQSFGDLSVTTTDGTDGKSGTWSVSHTTSLYDFYVVKGNNEYAIYYLNPAVSSGDWVTYHLLTSQAKGNGNGTSTIPSISHLSVYLDPPSQVPEPASMLLFGTGLIGLAGMLRSKKK